MPMRLAREDLRRGGAGAEVEAAPFVRHIQAVLLPGEEQAPAQLARAVEKILLLIGSERLRLAPEAVFCYNINVLNGLGPPG